MNQPKAEHGASAVGSADFCIVEDLMSLKSSTSIFEKALLSVTGTVEGWGEGLGLGLGLRLS